MTLQRVNAVVLMGSRTGESDPVCDAEGLEHKALARVADQTIIEIVLKALIASSKVADIYLCCKKGLKLPHMDSLGENKIKLVEICCDTPAGTIIEFMKEYKQNLPVLVVTSDLALLSAKIVDNFIDSALSASADLLIGFVNMVDTLSVFPDAMRTCIKFRDGWYNVCNLYFVNDMKCIDFLYFWSKIGKNRKKPLALAYELGFFNLLNYLLRLSSLEASLKRLGRRFFCRLDVVRVPYGQASVDVDKLSDLKLVREYINNKKNMIGI